MSPTAAIRPSKPLSTQQAIHVPQLCIKMRGRPRPSCHSRPQSPGLGETSSGAITGDAYLETYPSILM